MKMRGCRVGFVKGPKAWWTWQKPTTEHHREHNDKRQITNAFIAYSFWHDGVACSQCSKDGKSRREYRDLPSPQSKIGWEAAQEQRWHAVRHVVTYSFNRCG